MTFNKSNVIVSGSRSSLSEYANYTTVYPKPAMVGGKIVLTQDMINKQNVKYIIKWNFDLDDETITVPEGCLIEFDGGSFSNGTLVGNETILVYNQEEEDVFKNVSLEGSFERSTSAIADKMDNTNGMAKIYLKKNKPLATQLTQPNTIYVIQYDFTLGEDITIPANCVLEFDGGSISASGSNDTITGSNTGIQAGLVKIFDTDVTLAGTWNVEGWCPEWFGAKGDGVTDDTEALQKLNGKTILLQEKTYIASNLEYNSYTSIIGINKFTSCLKQKNNSTGDFIKLIDWFAGRLENIRVQGVNDTTYAADAWMPALIKIGNYTYNHYDGDRNWDETDRSTYYSSINNVVIRDGVKCGLTILGNTEHEGHKYWWNYIHHISNLWVACCGEYGIYDNATDNLWDNINVSHCGFADLYISGSSEVFTTLKLDGQPGYAIDTETPIDTILWDRYKGAALVNIGSGIIIDGLDVQSSKYCGIKHDGNNCRISGTVNNCGLAFPNDLSSQYKCPAILFYGQNKNTCNQINLVVYQLDPNKVIGSGVIEYRESENVRDNSVDIIYRPYDNDTSHDSYKNFVSKITAFGKKNNINRDEVNIGIVFSTSTTDNFRVTTVEDWLSSDNSNRVPQGLLIPCSTGDFILSLYDLAEQSDLKLSADSNVHLYGTSHKFNPLEDNEGLETTYGNFNNSDLDQNSAFKKVAQHTYTGCSIRNWYIWTAAQAITVARNVNKINSILAMLGGNEIDLSYPYRKYWTSTLATPGYAFYLQTYQKMLYEASSKTACRVRPVANFNDNVPLYKHGSTSLRQTMDNTPVPVGHCYFDTTLGKPVYWTGDITKGDNGWVDANGQAPQANT